MHITPGGMDGYLVLNGRQKRVLNVALYPFIPSLPQGNFRALVQHVIAVYQERNPDVLLNAVMNEDVDIYSPTRLLRLLSGSGYDVVELDTLYIAFLAAHGRIAPVRISGDEPWQPGLDAVQYHGGTYAVPSWLCLDFLYSYSPICATSMAWSSFWLSCSVNRRKNATSPPIFQARPACRPFTWTDMCSATAMTISAMPSACHRTRRWWPACKTGRYLYGREGEPLCGWHIKPRRGWRS
ncbi:hypothetical protein RAA17_15465 [Komagataeibacter rhaeticus]|nr:hypothetical protein [Komagataeibacter rhaeticus]